MTAPIGGTPALPSWRSGGPLTDRLAGMGGSGQGMPNVGGRQDGEGASFLKELKNALSQVNEFQRQAQAAGQNVAGGSIDDVARAMVAAQKASLALDLTVEVRNRALDAYQQIMRMQV